MLWLILLVFVIASFALAMYGMHLYALLYLFRRRRGEARRLQRERVTAYWRDRPADTCPLVTTQIPIYNEWNVVRRVIEAAARIDYPAGRHEIQVLDDSDDETRELIDRVAERLTARGVDIQVVRRADRSGYKAGALAHGLRTAKGTYIGVFDADFVPPADFLHKAVPLLEASEDLACIQGRWCHLNREESWLTEAQALGIDGHFAIEQGARAWNGLMMNFNGTAGVWRAAAINDPAVGGWSGDTLTEDLDLSYRAQLAGWRIDYCLEMGCPAELPGTVEALKSQQRRWATGSIQVACKLLPRIWRARLRLTTKLEATLHLTHYSVALWMLVLALVARPMLLVFAQKDFFPHWFWVAWMTLLLTAFAPSLVYAYARYSLGGRWSGFRTIPSMMILGCGMCLNNALAVIRGFYLHGGEFVRTPKSGSAGGEGKGSHYRLAQTHMWVGEIMLGVYSLLSFVIYFSATEHRAFSVFLLLYALGFLLIGWASRPRR
ncbi:MAG: glycosyltransferase, partial [Phycisphaerae bacterium]